MKELIAEMNRFGVVLPTSQELKLLNEIVKLRGQNGC